MATWWRSAPPRSSSCRTTSSAACWPTSSATTSGSTPSPLTITHWLSLPIITLARIGFLLERLAFAASDLLARRSAGLALIGRIVSAILQVIALAFLATVLIARRIGDRLGRSSEFTADERAVDMGYGRHLVMALRRVHAMDRQEAAQNELPRAFGGHPSPVLRTARIEARLRANRA